MLVERYIISFLLLKIVRGMVIETQSSPLLNKRGVSNTTFLSESIWTTVISSTRTTTITPYEFDGITVSATPTFDVSSPWISLDSSGIPYKVTPTSNNGTLLNTSPTPTNENYPTPIAKPPVLRCLNERVPSYTNPFCLENSTFVVDETYWITWNPLYWYPFTTDNNVAKVKMKLRSYPDTNLSVPDVMDSDWLENDDAYFMFQPQESYITEENDGYLQIIMSPFVKNTTDGIVLEYIAGPVVKIVTSKNEVSRVPSDILKKKSSNNAKVIAPAVIVPVVVVVVIIFVVLHYFWNRNNKIQDNDPSQIRMSILSKLFTGGTHTGRQNPKDKGNPFNDTSSYSTLPKSY